MDHVFPTNMNQKQETDHGPPMYYFVRCRRRTVGKMSSKWVIKKAYKRKVNGFHIVLKVAWSAVCDHTRLPVPQL